MELAELIAYIVILCPILLVVFALTKGICNLVARNKLSELQISSIGIIVFFTILMYLPLPETEPVDKDAVASQDYNEQSVIPTNSIKRTNQEYVYSHRLDRKIFVSRDDINTADLRCIARFSVYRDFANPNSEGYKIVTEKQNEVILQYDYAIPRKWIDEEKERFISMARNITDSQWEINKVYECLTH